MFYLHKLFMAVILGVALSMPCPIMAQTIAYSYDLGNGVTSPFGTSKIENYDVAIRLNDSRLIGMAITSVSMPLADNGIENVSVWLSKKLTLELIDEKKVNVPDILSVEALPANGWVTVTFENPYTITADGVYVGCSFEVSQLTEDTKKPVLLTSVPSTEGFYIHSSRQYRSWDNLSEEGSSCMIVNLLGSPANSVAFSAPDRVDAGPGISPIIPLTLTNYGYNGINSVICSSIGHDGKRYECEVELGENPVPAQYGMTRDIEVHLPPISEKGEYPFELTLLTVNGEENSYKNDSHVVTINVVGELFPHRAVVEEYTGFWCGWCPSGSVALDMMSERYPDDFIALAYHNSDSLAITNDYPSSVTSFPAAYIDRASAQLDPYLGSNTLTYDFGLEKDWTERTRVAAPAEVTVSGELSQDGASVGMSTRIYFPESETQADYKVEFVLVADNLHNPKWVQVNYFHGNDDYADSEGMTDLVAGDEYLWDVNYNDVVIATSRLSGNDALLPTEIRTGMTYEYEYTFDVTKVLNIYDKEILLDKTNLRVVALLVDGNGQIVNANKANVDSEAYEAGIGDIVFDIPMTGEYLYYDIYGRRLSRPQRGVTIIKSPNGAVQKAIIR